MSTRSSRTARRRRRRRAQQLTPSERQLYGLAEHFRRQAVQREQARQQAALVPPADPRRLAREVEQAAKAAAMARLVARTQARLAAQDKADWARQQRYEQEPMTGPATWSRPPMVP